MKITVDRETWNVHTSYEDRPPGGHVHIITAKSAVNSDAVQAPGWKKTDRLLAIDVDWVIDAGNGDVLLWRYAD